MLITSDLQIATRVGRNVGVVVTRDMAHFVLIMPLPLIAHGQGAQSLISANHKPPRIFILWTKDVDNLHRH
jgi:hypothetical protein